LVLFLKAKKKFDLVFKEFYFPEDAGLPIGRADSPRLLILEIHYDNPENKQGTLSEKLYSFLNSVLMKMRCVSM